MTMVDSDSASQDSDDGRRFRFEATRKDAFTPKETTNERETSRKFRSDKSSRCESSDRHYRDRRERSKHESDKRTKDDKDLRHSSRYSRHESRGTKQEHNKTVHKNHRSSRDASVGSTAATDRDTRNSSGVDTRERSRSSRHQSSDKDRGVYPARRSKERSHDRNHHEGRASSGDKRRSRDRHKRRSRDKSPSRSHQSNKVKSSNGDYQYRDGHGKPRDSLGKRTSSKENKQRNSKERLSPSSRSVEKTRDHSENTRNTDANDSQADKDLDLSQFDVLSEIDENMSDSRDSEGRASYSPRSRKRHESGESRADVKKRTREHGENGTSEREQPAEESRKVKQRKYDRVSTSSNNPSAISDSSLRDLASSATLSITREFLADFEREKSERAEGAVINRNDDDDDDDDNDVNDDDDDDDGSERLDVSASDETRLKKSTERGTSEPVYGPLLPPRFVSSDKLETVSDNTHDENKIINDDSVNSATKFIGPRLPSLMNDCGQNDEQRDDAENIADVTFNMSEVDAVFGPALPPHLIQRQRDNNSRDRIIGPILPSAETLQKESSSWDSDDDDSAIGPLPADHPALRDSQVHEQLDLRARRIRQEGYPIEVSYIKNETAILKN